MKYKTGILTFVCVFLPHAGLLNLYPLNINEGKLYISMSQLICVQVKPSYLSVYVEGAGLFVQVYVSDSRNFTRLLNVGPVSPNGETH